MKLICILSALLFGLEAYALCSKEEALRLLSAPLQNQEEGVASIEPPIIDENVDLDQDVLTLYLSALDTVEQNWCLITRVLESKSEENDLDELAVVKAIGKSDLSILTVESKSLIDHIILNAKNRNEIDEDKLVSRLLSRSIIIENEEKLEIAKAVFDHAGAKNNINDNKFFDLIVGLDFIDQDKKEFLQAAIYTAINPTNIDRSIILSRLEDKKIHGQDFLDSLGHARMKLFSILFLGEKKNNKISEKPLYTTLAEVIILSEDEYLCTATKLIKYLNEKNKPRVLASESAGQIFDGEVRNKCAKIKVLSELEIDSYLERKLNIARDKYRKHFINTTLKISYNN